MTTTMGVFIISFFLLTVFFAIKFLEIKLNKKTFISSFVSKGDHYIFRMKKIIEFLIHDNKQKTIFFFLFHLPERIEVFFRELKKKAHDKYYSVSDRVRGKQTLAPRSDISPFIRNIGKVEDEGKL